MTRKNIFLLSVAVIGAFAIGGAFFFFGDAGDGCGKRMFAPAKCAEILQHIETKEVFTSKEKAPAPPSVSYAAILEKFKGKDMERAPVAEKLFALTFDGGGNADGAEKILRTLSGNNIRATFFLTGNFIEKFPDIAKRIAYSDNEIANHTMTHKNLSEISEEEAHAEISDVERAAEALGIRVVPFFRFPYGAPTKEKIALVNGRGYVAVRWTVDSLGWQGKKDGRDAQFVAKRVIQKAVPGGIALMHLGSAKDGSTFDADALPEIITALRKEGYQLVPLSELFNEAIKNTAFR